MTINFQISIDPNLLSVLRTFAKWLTDRATTLSEINAQGVLMTQQLQTLTDQVTANNTLVGSTIQLISGLAAQIVAAKDDPAALQALADSLKAEDDTLAAAVLANTPAPAPPVPAPPAPPAS
jgi:prophage antirepressor-like protein